MARLPKPTPIKVRRLFDPGTEALRRGIHESTEVSDLLTDAVDLARAADALEDDALACEAARTRCDAAIMTAVSLLLTQDDIRHFFGLHLHTTLVWLVKAWAFPEREIESGPCLRREALLPGQQVRMEVCEGRRVRVGNRASPAELHQLQPYDLWEAERVSGQPANLRGRSTGDGRKPPEGFYLALEAGLAKCRSQELTLPLLAQRMKKDRRTLKKYLDDYGPPWLLLQAQRTLAACRAAGWQQPTAPI
jgi:hypothetical protein